jgi:two-component system sensor histidine kinase HydH
MELLRSEAARCSKLLNTFLSSASRAPGYPTPVESGEFVQGIASLLTHEAATKRCSLVAEIPEASPTIVTYVQELRQVLLNLTLNAIQVSPEGGRIVLSTTYTDQELSFHVSDQGPGVPSNMQEKIFEPFTSGKPPAVSTGLGLSTSRRLVEQMHGRITVTNNPLGGATFTVTLPRAVEVPKSMPPGGPA